MKGISCQLVVRKSVSSVFFVTFMKVDLYFCCMSLWVRAQCEGSWRTAVADLVRVLEASPKTWKNISQRDGQRLPVGVADGHCRVTWPGPRPLAGQEVDAAPGDADDVSRPGADRWHCRCWLES